IVLGKDTFGQAGSCLDEQRAFPASEHALACWCVPHGLLLLSFMDLACRSVCPFQHGQTSRPTETAQSSFDCGWRAITTPRCGSAASRDAARDAAGRSLRG